MRAPSPTRPSADWLRPPRLLLAVVGVAVSGACAADAPVAPLPMPPLEERVIEQFDPWDPARWLVSSHALGRGVFRPANVRPGSGAVDLLLPAGTYDGAEIHTAALLGHGRYTATLQTPRATGSLTAFFLYQPGTASADEIDIEILNDGSRTVLLTTWVGGNRTHHTRRTLPFDPADGPHTYEIVHLADALSFLADGQTLLTWRRNLPSAPMHLMVSSWWPTWLEGPPPAATQAARLTRVTMEVAAGG